MIGSPSDTAATVVTGASSGIGAALARRLAGDGEHLILLGRDRSRLFGLRDELRAHAVTVDFADFGSVRRAAAEVLSASGPVRRLFSNAGAAIGSRERTVDGHEPNLQVNALGPLLFESLLHDALVAGAGRVIATSSRSHLGASLSRSDLASTLEDRSGRAHDRYARAKLAQLLAHQARRMDPSWPETYDVHPGLVASDFGRYLGRTGGLLKVLATPVLRSPAAAAGTLARISRDERLAATYFHRDRPHEPSALVGDAALAQDVLGFVERMTTR